MTNRMSCCHSEDTTASQPNASGSIPKRPFDKMFWLSLLGVALLFIMAQWFSEEVSAHPWLVTMSDTALHMVHAMWWGVILGMVFIGVLTRIPKRFIMSILGQGGTLGGLFRAAGAGVLLDLCSHGILMVAVKLYERGASAGQMIAFLLASPWNSLSLTLVLIGLIGWQWTLGFIILSVLIALVTGWVFDVLVTCKVLPTNPNTNAVEDGFSFWAEAKAGLRNTTIDLRFAVDTMAAGIKGAKMVLRWLLFGILLAAILRAVLDPSQFQNYFGPTLLGLFITIAVATVMEVCSEGSVPIATDIFHRGQAPGNGFAFLMAGVATDYTEVMVIRDTSKSWKLALLLPILSVPQVVLVAWLINISG